MTKERFTFADGAKIVAIKDNGKIMSSKQVCEKLNDYEQIRLRNRREIAKYKAREERYQRVIGGMMAYLELQANTDLWWGWND